MPVSAVTLALVVDMPVDLPDTASAAVYISRAECALVFHTVRHEPPVADIPADHSFTTVLGMAFTMDSMADSTITDASMITIASATASALTASATAAGDTATVIRGGAGTTIPGSGIGPAMMLSSTPTTTTISRKQTR